MRRNSYNSGSSGLGTGSVIQIVFLVLKLTHLIDWSWVWVLSPTWISLIIVVIILVVCELKFRL